MSKRFSFEVVEGETDGIDFKGRPHRRRTVLLRIGSRSLSWKAFKLGMALAIFQVLDGALTYLGLWLRGIEMEGNLFLRTLMHAYGTFFALFVTKICALGLVITLTLFAHRRKWVRPIIAVLCFIYLCLAVIPWVYIISTDPGL